MIVEIINVGTELLLGEIVNTNATYLQKMCRELGFNVYYQSVVGDNISRLEECLEIAFNRGADCVITTGGLGPTADDLTKELSAKYLGLEMEYLEEEAQKVYDKCSFVMNNTFIPDNNYKQAYFPKGSYILENGVGTANGCVMSKDEKMIINLPGPPKEMTYMVDHVLKPYLEPLKQESIFTCDIYTMGIGESNMAVKLKDIIDTQTDISIALYATEDHCRVRLGTKAKSQSEANEKMKNVKHQIEVILSSWIIDYAHIRELVFFKMRKFKVIYETDFRLDEDFFNHELLKQKFLGIDQFDKLDMKNLLNQDHASIVINVKEVPLGEKVIISYIDQTISSIEVNLLKKASLSMKKLEGKLIMQLYAWLYK